MHDLLAVFTLRLYCVYSVEWPQKQTAFHLAASTSRLTSVLNILFVFVVFMFIYDKLMSAQSGGGRAPFSSSLYPLCVALVVTYPEAMLKSNGDKTSPHICRKFWAGVALYKCLHLPCWCYGLPK
jgi:hypothetical protein